MSEFQGDTVVPSAQRTQGLIIYNDSAGSFVRGRASTRKRTATTKVADQEETTPPFDGYME